MTSREVNALLAQSDHMLADNHFAAPLLREEAWNLRELLEDFSARTKEREKTLYDAADFFRNTEKVHVQEGESESEREREREGGGEGEG